uniref:Uncharacterized protein n=1 Tax=Manihot esculenta TaxID=3983 RepID=A0A2C9V4F2_MANES
MEGDQFTLVTVRLTNNSADPPIIQAWIFVLASHSISVVDVR